MKKKDKPKQMKITTSQLSITTKDNRVITVTIEEARELYDYLGTIFASKDATPALPAPVVPYAPPEPYRNPSPWIKDYPWNEPIRPWDSPITYWHEPAGSFVVDSNRHMDRVMEFGGQRREAHV